MTHDLPRRLTCTVALCLLAALFAGTPARAASCPAMTTTTYSGPAGGTWNSASNWSGAALPAAGDQVCIPPGKGTVDIPKGLVATAGLVSAASPVRVHAGATLAIADATLGHVSTFDGLDVDGEIMGTTSAVRLDGGTLSGDGTIDLPFQDNGGTIAPGGEGAVGTLHFKRQFSQSAGTLALDLASDSSFDKLVVDGQSDAFFGDQIAVSVLGAYAPKVGANWTIMSGAGGSETGFATVSPGMFSKVAVPGGLGLSLSAPLPAPAPKPKPKPAPAPTPAADPAPPPPAPATVVPPLVTAPSAIPSAAPSVSPPVDRVLLGCTDRKLVLNNVVMSGGRVVLDGAAAASLAGQTVRILFDGRTQVASAAIGPNGAFHTTAPLPPKRARTLNSTRYTAVAGAERSLDLKLVRRVVLQAPLSSARTVELTGRVLPPLAAPAASVTVTEQVACGATRVVATFKPAAGGRFHVTVPAPAGASAAIYRLQTRVRRTAHGRRSSATFSLPVPAALVAAA
jgi:hypothetical protein